MRWFQDKGDCVPEAMSALGKPGWIGDSRSVVALLGVTYDTDPVGFHQSLVLGVTQVGVG